MMPFRSHLARYLIGFALVGIIAAARLAIDAYVGYIGMFALFYVAVLLSAHVGGLGPGLFATGLSSLSVAALFSSRAAPAGASAAIIAGHVAFVSTGVMISLLSEARRRSRDHAAEALAELARQREWARVTLASIGDGVIATDTQGRVIVLNRVAEELTGFTEEEAKGRPLDDVFQLINQDTRERIRSPFEAVIREGKIVGLSSRTALIAKDGEHIPIDDSGAPIREGDRMRGVVLVFRDVSERMSLEVERQKLLEGERTARAEAEHMVRTKDEFLATLSHELRTPLNAILGWSQILRTGKMGPNDITRGLEVIERNARAQTKLVEDLLDMSRIISGKARLDVKPVDLTSVVEAALEAVRPAAQAKSIRLSRTLDLAAGSTLGDPARLQQIIWNLLSNAIKFTPTGGSVDITLRRNGADAEIAVTDTGQGIAPEFMPHMFERFRQADASVTRVHSGLGLGLAIARHLVELHGGTIRASSEGSGRGAVFVVRLPGAQEARDRTPDPPPASERVSEPMAYTPPPLDGLKVLVVDDDQDARELGVRILIEQKADVVSASSAAEALETLKREQPHVLVSDIGMPGEDGYSLIGKVRALGEEGGGTIPAIALTAFARPDDRRRALLAGFQVHLPKPVDPVELLAAVAALSGRTARSLKPRKK